MQKLTFASITLDDLTQLVNLNEQASVRHDWTQVEALSLTEDEQRRLQEIQAGIIDEPLHVMNEATLWARAIYPLLMLAERESIRAWGEVSLQARYPNFELEGLADGALGRSVGGRLQSPYLVVVETKRGVAGQNPIWQLYGQLLAAAWLNWRQNRQTPQEIFGCYTIADSWTFIRAEVDGLESDRPTLQIESSREYTEKVDAETILKLLKTIVNRALKRNREINRVCLNKPTSL